MLRFGDTGAAQHILITQRPLRVVSRGGFAALASVKFTADPATAGADFTVLVLRVLGSDAQSVLLYTDAEAGGVLKAGLCDGVGCVYAATAAPPSPGVWLTVGLRYVEAATRLELWADDGAAAWAGLEAAVVTVRR